MFKPIEIISLYMHLIREFLRGCTNFFFVGMYQKSILKCIKKESKLGILDQVKIKRGSNTKSKLIKKGRLQHMSSISDKKMHRSLIDIVLQPSF